MVPKPPKSCWSMKYVTPASFAPGPRSSAGIRRATAASRNATSAALRNMYFSLFAAPCACCCAPAAAGMLAAPSAPTDFRKRRRPPDSSMSPPQVVSASAANEFQHLAAERVVGRVELVDHREMVVFLHAREARAGAVALAECREQQCALRVEVRIVVLGHDDESRQRRGALDVRQRGARRVLLRVGTEIGLEILQVRVRGMRVEMIAPAHQH